MFVINTREIRKTQPAPSDALPDYDQYQLKFEQCDTGRFMKCVNL